ncbi:hypothetical protein MARI_30900 [Marinobacter sp. JH2]|nr:hypothetical protein MARI_30900 [Marinobacter sp. JH2]
MAARCKSDDYTAKVSDCPEQENNDGKRYEIR